MSMIMSMIGSFAALTISGMDAEKFLQGQVTVDVRNLHSEGQRVYTAICDLKGRVQFGLWLTRRTQDQSGSSFELICSADQLSALQAHLKKYSAFSSLTLSPPTPLYPVVLLNGLADFGREDTAQWHAWQQHMIAQGQAWITAKTAGLFQPQELRLHQRGGVDYDKGCYLGQDVVARLWFKAQPKQWLHRIHGTGDVPAAGASLNAHTQVVNAVAVKDGWEALVVARPDALEGLDVLDLPQPLVGSVARQASMP